MNPACVAMMRYGIIAQFAKEEIFFLSWHMCVVIAAAQALVRVCILSAGEIFWRPPKVSDEQSVGRARGRRDCPLHPDGAIYWE